MLPSQLAGQAGNRMQGMALRLALVLGVLAAVLFLALRLDSSLQFQDLITADNLALLAAALVLMAACIAGFGYLWCRILDHLAGGHVRAGMRAFVYTWLGRYVPGTVPYHAARILLAGSLGTTKRVVATSIAYESILILGGASFVGVVGVLIGLGTAMSSGWLYVLAGALLMLLPLGLHPKVLLPVANRALRLAGRDGFPADSLLTARQTLLLFFGFAGVYVLNGFAFYIITQALGENINPAVAIGAYNLAGVIGIVVLLVPSGLGVREAALVALLSGVMSPESALLAAGLARAVATVSDLLTPAAFAAYELGRRMSRTGGG